MKLSEWKPCLLESIDRVQKEAGIQVPALHDLRDRIHVADASSAQVRECLENEMETLLHSQPFLREAAARSQSKGAKEAIASAEALLKHARAVLPEKYLEHIAPTGLDPFDDGANSEEKCTIKVIDVSDAIRDAERLLPGRAAPEGESDPRWQAIMRIEDFIEEKPDAIWAFVLRWGVNDDEDLRTAIATCLLEHLLERHFDRFFPQIEAAARTDAMLADTFSRCWKLGQAEEPGNAERFEALMADCRMSRPKA